MCGEKPRSSQACPSSVGSSPRVRGKEKGRRDGCDHQRITPACAGKRSVSSWAICPAWDHPRMCGEKLVTEFITRYMMGSPLRVRGKVGPVIQLRAGPGITPAYAGKRGRKEVAPMSNRDHPRVCGEKITDETIGVVIQGSPPRVRGKVSVLLVDVVMLRVTPACAGKS